MPRSGRRTSKKGKPDVMSTSYHEDNVWEDDVEPPPSDDADDEKSDEDGFIDVVSDAGEEEAATKGNSHDAFSFAVPEFEPDELPLLGYALASFVFFLAAVTRRRNNSSLAALLDDDDADIRDYSGILSDSYPDNLFAFDDNTFMDNDSALAQELLESIVEQCEASYNAISGGANNLIANALGGYGGALPTGHFAYAMCLGIFGALLGVGAIAWKRTIASTGGNRSRNREDGDDDDEEEDRRPSQSNSGIFLFNVVLLVWASIGWAFFTFGGNEVFAYTGNGFFALWAMLLCAVWNFGITIDEVVQKYDNVDSCIYALVATSVIEIIELATGIGPNMYRGVSAYSIAVSVIAILFGLLTAGFSVMAARGDSAKLDAKISFWCVLVIFVLSIVAAFLTTFIGPFLTTGNGYFAVWGSVLLSGLACSKLRKEMQQDLP